MRIGSILIISLIFSLGCMAQNGVVKETNSDGILEEITYRSGIRKGAYKMYYPDNSRVHIKGQYKNNLREGRWNFVNYTPDGKEYTYQYFTYANDTLNGSFKKQSGDTVIQGAYKNGKMDGSYTKRGFSLLDSGDTLYIPAEDGEYRADKRSGNWKIYKGGVLHLEGMYLSGQRRGFWKTYGLHHRPAEVMIETFYKKDIRNGKETQYFEYDKTQTTYKKRKVFKQAIYHEGHLQGQYIHKDANGKLVAKGEYIEGHKVSTWQEKDSKTGLMMFANYFDGRLAGPVEYKDPNGNIMIKGSYDNNIKNGKWSWFGKQGKPIKEISYNHGKIHGDLNEYTDNGIKTIYMSFENDLLLRIVKFNSQGTEGVMEYDITADDPEKNWATVEVKEAVTDSTFYTTYVFERTEPINHETFVTEFNAAIRSGKCYKDGTFEKDVNENMLYSGNYSKNKKDGLWEYDWLPNIRWQRTFSNDQLTKEFFIVTKTKEPFEGDYILKHSNGNLKSEFKIKEGMRNGKSRYYNKSGVEVKSEKYKEGVRQ